MQYIIYFRMGDHDELSVAIAAFETNGVGKLFEYLFHLVRNDTRA
jgi:hypothetical protein